MPPLDLQRLATRGTPRCAVHGQACPTGGGLFSRRLYDTLAADVWPLVEAPVPTWEEWTTTQASRCRPVTPAQHRDQEGSRAIVAEATDASAAAARRWLADNDARTM